jgi:hypothetical protein
MTSVGSITIVDSGISPTSGQGSQSLLTGTPTANSSVAAQAGGAATVAIQISGTWTGTLSFEKSLDGTTFIPAQVFLVVGTTTTALTSVTGNCVLYAATNGTTIFRVRATAAVTGTAVVSVATAPGTASVHTA